MSQRRNVFSRISPVFVVVVLTIRLFASQSETILHSFAGAPGDGKFPMAGLTFDKTGAAYGTTTSGGQFGYGTIFKLTRSSTSSWTESVIYNFQGALDGGTPYGGVIFDGTGALYGTTAGGGTGTCVYQTAKGCGVIYKLTPSASGAWTETVLYTFTGGSDGANPLATLVLKGNILYGTTVRGGISNSGVVFQISSSNGSWKEKVLHKFGGTGDGAGPAAAITFDKNGNIWGTTTSGGSSQFWGTVFRMQPGTSGTWTETVIYNFTNGADGGLPGAPMLFDAIGNAYSTTLFGGASGHGTVFELTAPANGNEAWTETVLYSFFGSADGGTPEAAVVFDKAGNLYGTASGGGEAGYGSVFQLTPPTSAGGSWTETTLYSFTSGADGAIPLSNVVLRGGLLYGTTDAGGNSLAGTVFELKP